MKKIRELIVNKDGFIPVKSYNPHNIHAHLLCDEFGLFAIVYASHLQDALDLAVDEGFMDSMLVPESDIEEEDYICRLGNASEAFNIDYLHCIER